MIENRRVKRKLQVFVSSTFNDLIEERQAAVEAILSSGNIPAGMELFSAGNESQLEVIKRWISESDVFLLILGGRYGTIESKSGKSYIHLEYEYAQSLNIPYFSIVMSDKALDRKVMEKGQEVLELERNFNYKEFKEIVLSKMCKIFDDNKDIKLAIHSTLLDFQKRYELSGWIRVDRNLSQQPALDNLNSSFRQDSKIFIEDMPKIKAKANKSPVSPELSAVICEPSNFSECQEIVDNLIKNKPVIVNLDNAINENIANRIIDFVSGATYCARGSVTKLSDRIFLFTPEYIDILKI